MFLSDRSFEVVVEADVSNLVTPACICGSAGLQRMSVVDFFCPAQPTLAMISRDRGMAQPAGGHRTAIVFMASGQASVSILCPDHVIHIPGPNHMDSITWIHVIGPSLYI